ncbi:VCBS repeat-containing protein [Metabacillus idriensis]|uniref:VCBS repeat-containing protein n=1 Tax=Metabacillus idriensis TaxID=324768 RepID=UPI002041DC9A|nr:VCBS repeat-containing protein [Metabacillus idriensis]
MDYRGKWKLGMYIAVGILLSGCDIGKYPNELIESPHPRDVRQIALNNTLNQLLPSSTEFMTPKQGVRKQSIYLEDINDDGKQEACILYKSLKGSKQVHLLVLQEKGEKWSEIANIETDYHTLDYFGLQDLDEDGVKEVVIGLGISEFETEKQLFIYQWDRTELKNVIDRSYDAIDIADYDGDEKKDVMLIVGKRRESFYAELLDYENGTLKPRSAVSLDAFAFHEKIVSGKLRDGKKALFIDSKIGVHSMLTEIVAYHDGELVTVGNESYKDYMLYSKDINQDGITEVGGVYIPKGWEDAAFGDIPFIEFYSTNAIDGASKKIEERLTDRVRRFYIEIPPAWYGKVTVKKIKNGIQLLSVSNHQLVFEVKWANKESINSSKIVLKETKNTTFYTDSKEMESFPFDQFHLLENEF